MSDRAVADDAVWSVVERMQRETDPIRKYALRSLLIEQEDCYGSIAEKLDRADAHIAAGHFKMQEIESAAASLKARGHDVATAERVLENLRDILETFDAYRELVLGSCAAAPSDPPLTAMATPPRPCSALRISLHANAMRRRLDSLLLLALGLSRPWAHS